MTNVYTKEQIDLIGTHLGSEIKEVKGLFSLLEGTLGQFTLLPISKEEYNSLLVKDPNTIYVVTYD